MAWLRSAPLFCVFLHTVYVHAIPDKTVVCATSVKGKLKHEFYVKEVLVTHFITKRSSRFRPFVCPTLIDGLRAMFFNPSSCWWLQTPDAVGITPTFEHPNPSSLRLTIGLLLSELLYFWLWHFDASNKSACLLSIFSYNGMFSFSFLIFATCVFQSLPWGTLRFC